MACFDPDELVDFIRHQFMINTDDNGQCRKILLPPSRKAKPGGLPLNFRSAADSHTSSGEYSQCHLVTPNYESTYELLQERLHLRIQENDLMVLNNESKAVKGDAIDALPIVPDSVFFQCRDVSCNPSSLPVQDSITALLLEKTDFMIRSELAAYARFAAPDIENGRKLLVFFPFAEPEPDSGKCFSLVIYAQCEICISDLVGLCCYEYARCRRTNNIESVTQYHLLMAEENGEVDRDLPAVDGHRLLSDLGLCWSTVALEKRQSLNCLGRIIIVYTISGKKYEFLMDSLDVPLRWLRDQVVKKRIENEDQEFMDDCSALREYVLEAVERPHVALDLNKPISSTACLEFLLLRINSSRGDFTTTHCSSFVQKSGSFSKINDDWINSSIERQQSFASFVDIKDFLGNSIALYSVEKICRYKPNWSALLAIRMDGFELTQNQLNQTRKRNFIFHPSPKTLNVTWNCVGGVEITDRSHSKKVVKIVWLSCPTIKQQSEVCKSEELQTKEFGSITQDSPLSFQSSNLAGNEELLMQKLYSDACWKTLQLEANVDDACSIAAKISTIIDDTNSAVCQIYKYSNGGTKKPKKSAVEAFGKDGNTQFKELIIPAAHGISHLALTMTNADSSTNEAVVET